MQQLPTFRPQLVNRVARRTIFRSISDSVQRETQTNKLARIKRQNVKLVTGQPASNGSVVPTVKVLQWNLLADGLAQNGDFIKVRPELLEWSYRKPLILAELLEAQADVIALQELNYFDEIQDTLKQLGYEGCFLAKLHSPAIKYSSPADGIALFWRTDRFQARERHSFHYRNGAGAPQPQACLSVLLADQSGKQLLVTTTHLKAKEGADLDEIRLLQMQQLLQGIDNILQHTPSNNDATASASTLTNGSCSPTRTTTSSSVPVIITGDFNTTANSKPCQLLASKNFTSIWDVPVQGGSSMDDADGDAAPALQGPSNSSSSNGTHASGPMPESCSFSPLEFSTWKFRSGGESKRIIDHMWFTGLLPRSRWRMLTEAEIGCAGLPCEGYPSDHVALCCEFSFE